MDIQAVLRLTLQLQIKAANIAEMLTVARMLMKECL